jgi:DNA polymerase-3 subunit gamma/tau
MAKVLYRKYRSKSLSEVVGQEHITKTLEKAIKSNRLSHAYLFTGPKGVGKTSVARILAHEVNNLPYTSDQAQIDIIEIDAASNRRIDEIRHLRDRVYIAPSVAKFKVYIIDEVHMLTKEAFNALLKTLEEPPEHVIFILATTDANKLPDTIISRTQRFNFKAADNDSIVGLLKGIAKSEKITIDDDALKLIADHGNGSYRDSIGLLDQLSSGHEKLTADYVNKALGLPSDDIIKKLTLLMGSSQKSYQAALDCLIELVGNGISPATTANFLMSELRELLVNNQLAMSKDQAITLLKDLIKVESSADPASFLEIIILDSINLSEAPSPIVNEEPAAEAPKQESTKTIPKAAPQEVKPLDEDTWQTILASLKSKHNTLYGIARMSKPIFTETDTLTLLFDFPFHQKQLKDSKNQKILNEAIKEATGKEYNIDIKLNENKDSDPTSSADLENINKIFGQTELID